MSGEVGERRQLRPGLWWTADLDHGRRWLDLATVLALCLLAFALRMHDLDGRSLWLDEGFTMRRISLSMGEIVTNQMPLDNVVTQDLHPALYFILLKLWGELGGLHLFVLKYVGVAWAVLLVPLFFATGRLLLSARAGRAAALFAALSPVYLWYAQDLRMYTQLAALSVLAVYALARASQLGRWWRWILAALVLAALCYTQYTGVLIALFEVVALAIITLYVGRARRLIALGLALLSTVPLILIVLPRVISVDVEPNYAFVSLDIIARDLLNAFSLGISVKVDQVWWLDEIFLAVVLIGVLGSYVAGQPARWRGARWLLLGYLVLPVLAYYLLTYVKPAYQGVRHLFVVGPAFYLLLARGLDILATRLRSVALAVLLLIVGGMAYSTEQYFTNQKYMKDDWRGLVRFVEANAWPRDVVIVNNTLLRPVLDTYNDGDGLTWVSAPELGLDMAIVTDTQVVSATLAALVAEHPRVWFVPGVPEDGRDRDHFVENWIEERLDLLDKWQFPGRTIKVGLRLYSSRPLLQDLPITGLHEAPAGLRWEGGLEVPAFLLRSPGYAAGGSMIPVQLAWVPRKAPDPTREYWVHLSLIDPAGSVMASVEEPVLPEGVSAWQPGKWLLSNHALFLPLGAFPGDYQVQITLMVRHDGALSTVHLLNGDTSAELGSLPVIATFTVPDVRRMPDFTPQQVRFAPGVELVGYRITSAGVRPGQSVAVQLSWRALRDGPPDNPVLFEMVDGFGEPVASGTGTLSPPAYPTRLWRKGQIVMSTVTMRVAGRAAGGWYRLRVELPGAQAYTNLWPFPRRAVELGQAQVTAWPLVAVMPPDATPAGARFGDHVTLAGYRVEGEAVPGGTALVTLYWRADRALPADAVDLVAYVHMIPENGADAPVLHDGVPGEGVRPVDTWRAGEIIVDRHILRLPADLAPGRYPVYVGLYHADGGARWPVALDGVLQPNDELLLLDMTVGAR